MITNNNITLTEDGKESAEMYGVDTSRPLKVLMEHYIVLMDESAVKQPQEDLRGLIPNQVTSSNGEPLSDKDIEAIQEYIHSEYDKRYFPACSATTLVLTKKGREDKSEGESMMDFLCSWWQAILADPEAEDKTGRFIWLVRYLFRTRDGKVPSPSTVKYALDKVFAEFNKGSET